MQAPLESILINSYQCQHKNLTGVWVYIIHCLGSSVLIELYISEPKEPRVATGREEWGSLEKFPLQCWVMSMNSRVLDSVCEFTTDLHRNIDSS